MSFEKILKFLLGLFLFLLPWQTIWIFRESFLDGVKMEYLTLGFYATEALLWVVIMMFITWYWKNYKLSRQSTGSRISSGQITNYKFRITKDRVFVLAVLSLISYLSLSLIWSTDKSLALQQSLRVIEAFLLFFILLLGPLKKEQAIKWLAIGSILPCVLGIWQFLTQSTFASTWLGLALHPAWQAGASVVASDTIGRWLRAYGSFAHPNVFGGYLVIVLFFTYHVSRITYQYDKVVQHVLRVMCYVLCVALFFTFSRSAWVAAAVVITYHLSRITYQRNHVMWYVLYGTCFVFLVTLFFPLIQTRLTSNSISETRSMTDRVSGYSEAWQIFKQNPILGVGAGNYTVAARELNPALKPWEIQPAHNVFVLFAVEGGVVGMGLLALVLTTFFTYHVSHIMYQRNRIVWYVLCGTCYVALAFADHYLYSSYIGLMLSALFFGLMLRKSNENTVSPQLVHCSSFDTSSTACHNTSAK